MRAVPRVLSSRVMCAVTSSRHARCPTCSRLVQADHARAQLPLGMKDFFAAESTFARAKNAAFMPISRRFMSVIWVSVCEMREL